MGVGGWVDGSVQKGVIGSARGTMRSTKPAHPLPPLVCLPERRSRHLARALHVLMCRLLSPFALPRLHRPAAFPAGRLHPIINAVHDRDVSASSPSGSPRSIICALSFFHAALLERKKFGVGNLPGSRSGIGWNMSYPFNTGDLLCCGQLAANYLDNNSKVGREGGREEGRAEKPRFALHGMPAALPVTTRHADPAPPPASPPPPPPPPAPPQVPWDDLRYLFGEIMYGGHIVEEFDRRLANAYLHKYFNEGLLEGPQLFPGFYPPPPTMPHPQVGGHVPTTAGGSEGASLCGRLRLAGSWQQDEQLPALLRASIVMRACSPAPPPHPHPPPTNLTVTPCLSPGRASQVMEYIEDSMPAESAVAFGLHPNAEIGFKLREAVAFCSNLQALQVGGRRRREGGGAGPHGSVARIGVSPRAVCPNTLLDHALFLSPPKPSPALQPHEAGGEEGLTVEEQARTVLESLMERIPPNFDLDDIRSRVDEYSPYVM